MATTCYVCGSERNEVALREGPMQIRFGKRVLPDDEYRQRICLDCGLLFVDYPVTDEYLNDLYSSESVDWQKRFTGSAMTEGEERVGEFRSLCDLMFRIRPVTEATKLLDFGCQTGEFGQVASEIGMVEPFGVDLSRDYADHAMKRWQRGFVHVGPLATSPFGRGTFDYISAQETLEHLVDPLRVLVKLRELIKDDGIILVTVPSTHYFMLKKRIFTLLGKSRALVHTHIYNFTPKCLVLLLEKARFRPVHLGGTGWHGPIRKIATPVGGAIFTLTGHRLVYYPSVVCIAKPVS